MGTLTIQVDDEELAWLQNAARALNIEPSNLTKNDLAALLACQDTAPKSEQDKNPGPDRAARRAALMQLRTLWQPDPSLPIDGVEYQKAMRAEWP